MYSLNLVQRLAGPSRNVLSSLGNTGGKCLSTVNAINLADEETKEWANALPYEEIPGPKAKPVIGNLHRFLPGGEFYNLQLADLYVKLRETYGEIVRLNGIANRNDLIMLFNPEEIKAVYRNEGIYPVRRGLQTFVHYRNEYRPEMFESGGLLSVQGHDWHLVRTKVNPAMMQPKIIRKYVEPVDEISQEFIDRMLELRDEKNEMPSDFWMEVNKWALESIGRIALDTRLGSIGGNPSAESLRLIKHVHMMFELIYQLDILPSVWQVVRTPNYYKLMECFDVLREITSKHVTNAVKRLDEAPPKNSEDELSVVERLITIDRTIGQVMAMDMLIAGIDTTSSAVCTLLYYLAKNPDQQQTLREELRAAMPDSKARVTIEVLRHLPYLRACIKESLRMVPVAPGNLRVNPKDMVLAGYRIPADTEILLGHMTLARCGTQFPRAGEYLPERWLKQRGSLADRHIDNEDISSKHAHPFSYMPFGFGPRTCIGRRFAELEIEVFTSKLIRNYKIEWNHGDMKFDSKMINFPVNPLRYKVTEID